jgi:hypothetical protein
MSSIVTDLQNATLFIVGLSFATERLTEITKATFFPKLLKEITDNEVSEARRQAKIQVLAAFSGIVVTGLSYPITGEYFKGFFSGQLSDAFAGILTIISLGLLASGSSGAWNNILGAILRLKTEPPK